MARAPQAPACLAACRVLVISGFSMDLMGHFMVVEMFLFCVGYGSGAGSGFLVIGFLDVGIGFGVVGWRGFSV